MGPRLAPPRLAADCRGSATLALTIRPAATDAIRRRTRHGGCVADVPPTHRAGAGAGRETEANDLDADPPVPSLRAALHLAQRARVSPVE